MGWLIVLVLVAGGATALLWKRARNRPVDDFNVEAAQRRAAEEQRRGPRENWGGV